MVKFYLERGEIPAKNYWFVPGGRIRKLETMCDCFARITRCEIGVEISIDKSKLIGAFEHIYETDSLRNNSHTIFLLVC